jgi:hypothetical protein
MQIADLRCRFVGGQFVPTVLIRLGFVLPMGVAHDLRTEQPASQRRCVAEDPDAEHDDDRGGQLGADPELVAEVDDQRGNEHVEDE